MVAKINIGSNLYGALAYNQEKVDEGLGKIIAANIIDEPTDGKFNISDCLLDFERWMPSHSRTEKPIIHISLNPHPDDCLTDCQLAEIGKEYMEQFGYGNQPFLIFKHEDIERQHIHIVSLRVRTDGSIIKDGNNYKRSKEITDDLEKKYGLLPKEKKQGEQWELKPVDYPQGDLKKQIASVIKPLASMYNFQSMGEYKAVLTLYNINMEELKGEVKGKPYRGILYSALDNKGEKIGSPLKSSIFGKMVGYDGLEKKMKKSAEQIKTKNLKVHTFKAVYDAKSSCRSESEFRAKLKEQGIDVLFRRNDQERIYGATFIDHTTRTVLNGSRLGKEFSANVFNDLYGTGQKPAFDQIKPEGSTSQSNNDIDGGNIISIVGSGQQVNDDKMPLTNRRKKKRRRYGRQD